MFHSLKREKKEEINTMFNTSLSCRTLTGAREIPPRSAEHGRENDIPELFSGRLTGESKSISGLFESFMLNVKFIGIRIPYQNNKDQKRPNYLKNRPNWMAQPYQPVFPNQESKLHFFRNFCVLRFILCTAISLLKHYLFCYN